MASSGFGKKFSASREVTLSKPPGRVGSSPIPPTTNETRGSTSRRRAYSMNDSEESHASTDAGLAPAQIASASAPVPHPTSSHLAPGGTHSHDTKRGARMRLQRPMKSS